MAAEPLQEALRARRPAGQVRPAGGFRAMLRRIVRQGWGRSEAFWDRVVRTFEHRLAPLTRLWRAWLAPDPEQPRRLRRRAHLQGEQLERRWLFDASFQGMGITVPSPDRMPGWTIEHPLSIAVSPREAWEPSFGLVFNPNTVAPKPILAFSVETDSGRGVPDKITGQLTWNGGDPQSTVTFGTSTHSAGDTYYLALVPLPKSLAA
jgi:hypothetical protein